MEHTANQHIPNTPTLIQSIRHREHERQSFEEDIRSPSRYFISLHLHKCMEKIAEIPSRNILSEFVFVLLTEKLEITLKYISRTT